MKKYIIKWNTGYGDNYDEVEAESEDDARDKAYDAWKEEAESNADYEVVGESTEELREDFGL